MSGIKSDWLSRPFAYGFQDLLIDSKAVKANNNGDIGQITKSAILIHGGSVGKSDQLSRLFT